MLKMVRYAFLLACVMEEVYTIVSKEKLVILESLTQKRSPAMKKDITDLFVFVDDFVAGLEKDHCTKHLQYSETKGMPTRIPGLSSSEIICILLDLFRN